MSAAYGGRDMAGGEPGQPEQKSLVDDFSPVSPIESDSDYEPARETQTAEIEAAEIEAAEIETAKPETAKPETAKPETAKPETAKPETAKPETAKPETAKPETAKPETAKLETAQTQAADAQAAETQPVEPQTADTRERSLSGATRRNSFYDSQRIERRPTSSAGQTTPRPKGKKPNVDFREPPESSPRREPLTNDVTTRPQHARGNSYTNFSRPDTVRPNSTKSTTQSTVQPSIIKTGASSTTNEQPAHATASTSAVKKQKRVSGTPTTASRRSRPSNHQSDRERGDDTSSEESAPVPAKGGQTVPGTSTVSANKQKRMSGTSTIGSRRFRPPIHQSDLERGNNVSSDESAPVPAFAQSLPADFLAGKKGQSTPETSWLTELHTISYLILFSFFGTLARVGIEWLTFYPGAIITTPIVWANFAGSLVMGFLVEDSRLFRDHWPETTGTTSRAEKRMSKQSTKSRRSLFSGDFDRMQRRERLKIKANIPLYVGLTAGFCGCFTSFSILARDMFLALSNDLPAPPYQSLTSGVSLGANLPRNGGYSFMAVIAVIITELTLSTGGFIVGRHMALSFERYTPRISLRFTSRILDNFVVVLAWGCWLGAVFLTIWPPDRPSGPQSAGSWANERWRGVALFALAFSPVGCLLRFYLSRSLNRLEPSFPLGTFAANMLGTAIMAVCYDLQHIGIGEGGSIGGGLLSCQALEGIIDGFTGCLTTVSTLVAELDALKRRYTWIYGLSTILAGLGLVVAILGPVRWTVGWSAPVCVVGYVNKYT